MNTENYTDQNARYILSTNFGKNKGAIRNGDWISTDGVLFRSTDKSIVSPLRVTTGVSGIFTKNKSKEYQIFINLPDYKTSDYLSKYIELPSECKTTSTIIINENENILKMLFRYDTKDLYRTTFTSSIAKSLRISSQDDELTIKVGRTEKIITGDATNVVGEVGNPTLVFNIKNSKEKPFEFSFKSNIAFKINGVEYFLKMTMIIWEPLIKKTTSPFNIQNINFSLIKK